MRATTVLGAIASAALLAATVATGATAAAADEGNPSPRQDVFAATRQATARYHEISQAAGFGELRDAAGIACIDNPAGGMGVHYVNGSRIDGVLDPERPEVLVYEPQSDGSMQLGAVEYVIFAGAWTGEDPPELFGHPFHYMPGQAEAHPNRYGLPAFWELHAWVWKTNPNGMFADWNPRVTCP